jgi:hypothetical protein
MQGTCRCRAVAEGERARDREAVANTGGYINSTQLDSVWAVAVKGAGDEGVS